MTAKGTAINWEFSAPDGVWKSRTLTDALMELAALDFIFVPFTNKVDGFGKKMGETVTIPHVKDLPVPASAILDEQMRVPLDTLQFGNRTITVAAWGRGVLYNDLFQQLSKFDPENIIQKALRKQMNRVMDNAAAGAFKKFKISFIPTSLTGGTWDTDGTPSTTALVNITKAHMGVIRDHLVTDLHIPMYDSKSYTGLFTTKGLRGLKDDKALEAWWMYLSKGDVIYNSEVGQVESIRCVEIKQNDVFVNGVGSGSVLGEGVVFGDEAVSRVEVETPELRANPNFGANFGLQKGICWYGIVAYDTTWDTANDREAKGILVTSA